MSDETNKKETSSKFGDAVMAAKAAKAAKKAQAKKDQAGAKPHVPHTHGGNAHGSLNTKGYTPRMMSRAKKG